MEQTWRKEAKNQDIKKLDRTANQVLHMIVIYVI